MNEEYNIRRKEIIKGFYRFLFTMTLVIGVFAFISIRNTLIDSQGPKDLAALDISKSKGYFVKVSFDKMYHHFANGEDTYKKTRFYFYPIHEKLLIVEIPESKFNDFDELIRLSNVGEFSVENPVEYKGRMVKIGYELKKIAWQKN